MGLRSSIAVAQAGVANHVRRAAVAVASKVGMDSPTGVPQRMKQAARHIARAAGVTSHQGIRPARYSPILLIAVALAESAHAPLMKSAKGAITNPSPLPKTTVVDKTPPSSDKKGSDMHGPSGDNLAPADRKKKKDLDSPRGDLTLLVDPINFHDPGINPIHTGGDGYLIPGGATGPDFQPQDSVTWSPIVHGFDGGVGGGGAGGDLAGGGGGGAGGGDSDGDSGGAGPSALIVRDGTQSTTGNDGPHVTSVPEPGSLSILMSGLLLLGRRRGQRRLSCG